MREINLKKIKIINFLAIFFADLFFVSKIFAASSELNEIKKIEAEQLKNRTTITMPTVTYKAEGARDPFQERGAGEKGSKVSQKTKLPEMTIQGIVWGGAFPQAIINNKVVKVGDTLDEARVIDISKEGITVFFGGRQYNLYSPAASQLQNKEEKPKGGKDEKYF